MLQDGISSVVAVLVVDGFEAVEIEDDERKSVAVPPGDFNGLSADLFECTAIEQAGQGVGPGTGLRVQAGVAPWRAR